MLLDFPVNHYAFWERRPSDPDVMSQALAEAVYAEYSKKYSGQSLARLKERGGWAIKELDDFIPDWRETWEGHYE